MPNLKMKNKRKGWKKRSINLKGSKPNGHICTKVTHSKDEKCSYQDKLGPHWWHQTKTDATYMKKSWAQTVRW